MPKSNPETPTGLKITVYTDESAREKYCIIQHPDDDISVDELIKLVNKEMTEKIAIENIALFMGTVKMLSGDRLSDYNVSGRKRLAITLKRCHPIVIKIANLNIIKIKKWMCIPTWALCMRTKIPIRLETTSTVKELIEKYITATGISGDPEDFVLSYNSEYIKNLEKPICDYGFTHKCTVTWWAGPCQKVKAIKS